MDGIETCRHLKADPKFCNIPIIFVTARTSQEGKLEGLRLGATDYITKPIDLEETLARVNTQLKMQKAHKDNLELNERINNIRRAAAIGSITQGISHNLNNLLGVVVGYLDLLKMSLDKPDTAKRNIIAIEKAIDRMVKLIRQLSRMASEEEVPRTFCTVSTLIRKSIARFQEESKREDTVKTVFEMDEHLKIKTNTEVFENMLCKLLINAFEACEKTDRPPLVSITLQIQKISVTSYLRILISDNGCGIDPNIVETLFEPFVSTQTAVGRGLGLTMVRHAVNSLKGSIEFTSEKDIGTTMTVMLPYDVPAATPAD